MALWIAVFAIVHAFAFLTLGKRDGVVKSPQLVAGLTGLFAVVASLMLSSGLKSSVEVLFTRGDLDLLLSSPLSSRGIFTVRLAGIVIGVASVFLFFLTPFANAGLVLGQYRWLGIYPLILGTATVAASLSMLFTLGLVRLLGVRRTRVVAQIVGALGGRDVLPAVAGLLANAPAASVNAPRTGWRRCWRPAARSVPTVSCGCQGAPSSATRCRCWRSASSRSSPSC